jgi:hypothetical protein
MKRKKEIGSLLEKDLDQSATINKAITESILQEWKKTFLEKDARWLNAESNKINEVELDEMILAYLGQRKK